MIGYSGLYLKKHVKQLVLVGNKAPKPACLMLVFWEVFLVSKVLKRKPFPVLPKISVQVIGERWGKWWKAADSGGDEELAPGGVISLFHHLPGGPGSQTGMAEETEGQEGKALDEVQGAFKLTQFEIWHQFHSPELTSLKP